jgi:putative endonuclease
MWHIYILLCSNGSLYTGSTNDLEKRFLAHQNGTGAKYTRANKPVRIICTENFETKSEAFKRESEIKSWTRAKKITELGLNL